MRVLVIAEDAEVSATRTRDLERARLEVCGTSDGAHVTARVRAERPDALLVVAPAATSELRTLLGRARDAADAALPAVVLVGSGSLWLHASLPDDLAPTVVLPLGASHEALRAAFAHLDAGARPDRRGSVGEVTVEYASRRVAGPAGEAWLTPSEAAVMAALTADPGAFVDTRVLAQALWGDALTDAHARGAIRTHVHTLRGKLRAAGFTGGVESKIGAGYRLVLDGPGES